MLCLILIVPLASGQAQVEATMTIEEELRFADLEPELPDQDDADQQLRPCAGFGDGERFRDSGRGFDFVEGRQEQACADAVFAIRAPDGQESLVVTFSAHKSVSQLAPEGTVSLDVGVVTSVILRDASGSRVLAEVPYFDETQGEEIDNDLVVAFDIGQAPRNLEIAFHFADEGPNAAQTVPNPAFGQAVTVQIVEPRIRFPDIPMIGGAERVSAEVSRGDIEEHLRLSGAVPAGANVVEVEFAVPNDLSIHHVEIPGGNHLAPSSFRASEEAGLLRLHLNRDVIEAFGPGTYVAVFSVQTPLEANAWLVPLVLLLFVAPVPTGLYATRSAGRLVAEASVNYRLSARSLRALLFFWWGVYLVALGAVVFGRLWPLVVSWPIQVEVALVHGAFLLVLLAFITLGVFWRRQLTVTMEAELVERTRMNRTLSRTNEELEQFAYVASHDLQEPLRTVARFTQLLERRYGDQLDDDAKEFIAYSVDGAHRMQQLIDGLLAFSRAGGRDNPFEAVHLEDVLDQVLASLTARLDETGAVVTRNALPVVHGDRGQLAQVLQNLLSNALKFQPEGAQPQVHVGATFENGAWTVSVQDNGIGIDPTYKDRVFVVFQRLHGRDAYSGTGIGLAICKKIIERHGGRIWVESEEGQGATFRFTLLHEETKRAPA